MQALIDKVETVPDFGAIGLAHGAKVVSRAAECGDRFHALVADVRSELRNEMAKALGGERQFVPSYTIDCNGIKKEKLAKVHDALMEAMEHGQNCKVLMSLLSGRGFHPCNLITLREGVIGAYVDLNAEAVAEARIGGM